MRNIFLLLLCIAQELLAETAPKYTTQKHDCKAKTFMRGGWQAKRNVSQDFSENWSGYVAPASNNAVTFVAGSWSVPLLHPPSDGMDHYAVAWVGIDGFSSNTVEQIGIDFDWVGGAPLYFAWYEMFPLNPVEIVGFPVNPGDLMYASVTYIGNDTMGNAKFDMIIENISRNAFYTTTQTASSLNPANRSSAEWILEDPSSGGSLLPLSNFGNTPFYQCTATVNGITAPITNSSWPTESLNMEDAGIIKVFTSSVFGSGMNFMTNWEHD